MKNIHISLNKDEILALKWAIWKLICNLPSEDKEHISETNKNIQYIKSIFNKIKLAIEGKVKGYGRDNFKRPKRYYLAKMIRMRYRKQGKSYKLIEELNTEHEVLGNSD